MAWRGGLLGRGAGLRRGLGVIGRLLGFDRKNRFWEDEVAMIESVSERRWSVDL